MDKEALKNEAMAFLHEQPMGVIATVGKDNIPEAASVNYLLEEGQILCVLTDKDSRKVQNLRENPNIAFVVGTTPVPHTVQIQGKAEIIESSNGAYEGMLQKMVESKRLESDPMYNMFGNNYDILKISITWMRWLYFDKSNGNPVYVEIIP
jgi:general stress protein 26